MSTLIYSPGSFWLTAHCLRGEFGVPFEVKRVEAASKDEYRGLNPKGKVPALATPDGVLTECVAIVEYLCDRHGDGKLLGKAGTWQRAKTLERIATLATEVHPLFNRFFHEDDFSDAKDVQASVKARATEKLFAYFREQESALDAPFWSGDALTAADIYFMVIARCGRWLTPPANEMAGIRPFYERMIARPAVARAMQREGIKAYGTT